MDLCHRLFACDYAYVYLAITVRQMKNFLFYLGVGFLFTHELDAMSNSEWLVLPLTSWLRAEQARLAFVLVHIPLFAIVVALIASPNPNLRNKSRLAVAAFLVIHGLLHVVFAGHEHYEFASTLSQLMIFGGALYGAGYLLLERMSAVSR